MIQAHWLQVSCCSHSKGTNFKLIKIHCDTLGLLYMDTLASGIDVGQGINLGPGKFGKKNKRRAL